MLNHISILFLQSRFWSQCSGGEIEKEKLVDAFSFAWPRLIKAIKNADNCCNEQSNNFNYGQSIAMVMVMCLDQRKTFSILEGPLLMQKDYF